MSIGNFNAALSIILHHEGGFVNNPKDPGGMTNLGVTKKTLEGFLHRSVTEKEMRALTPTSVAPLYKTQYWDAVECDQIPVGLDLCIFDFAVNAGTGRAAKFIQRVVGAAEDGNIGPRTLSLLQQEVRTQGINKIIGKFQDARADYYKSLKTFPTFGKDWLRRVSEVTTAAQQMAGGR
jgi:lysozyme family protein